MLLLVQRHLIEGIGKVGKGFFQTRNLWSPLLSPLDILCTPGLCTNLCSFPPLCLSACFLFWTPLLCFGTVLPMEWTSIIVWILDDLVGLRRPRVTVVQVFSTSTCNLCRTTIVYRQYDHILCCKIMPATHIIVSFTLHFVSNRIAGNLSKWRVNCS